MKSLTFFLINILSLLLSVSAFAQYGYSSGSVSMGKERSNRYAFPSPEEVIVEEYMNYHQHQIALPSGNESVSIDLRWGNQEVNTFLDHALLQVGFATSKIQDYDKIPPVNVSLVIDRSGSMDGNRIAKAREAAVTFVKHLREKDRLSVVIFDDKIEVLLPPQQVTDKKKIIQTIQNIEVRGSTDLNGGLIKGYEQVAQHYKNTQANRVILLTDALTNTGEIDPEKIVQSSAFYSKNHEISITVIGVGVDFNNNLARQITNSGKHTLHFLNDEEDLQKVFVNEVEALLSPIAKDIMLEMEYDSDLELSHFSGYHPQYWDNTISMKLNNINAGLTQILLLDFKPKTLKKQYDVKVKLSYYDIQQQKTITQKKSIQLHYWSDGLETELLKDKDVKKNYVITQMAEALKEMAVYADKKEWKKAEAIIRSSISFTDKHFSQNQDADVKRVRDIMEHYIQVFDYVAKNKN